MFFFFLACTMVHLACILKSDNSGNGACRSNQSLWWFFFLYVALLDSLDKVTSCILLLRPWSLTNLLHCLKKRLLLTREAPNAYGLLFFTRLWFAYRELRRIRHHLHRLTHRNYAFSREENRMLIWDVLALAISYAQSNSNNIEYYCKKMSSLHMHGSHSHHFIIYNHPISLKRAKSSIWMLSSAAPSSASWNTCTKVHPERRMHQWPSALANEVLRTTSFFLSSSTSILCIFVLSPTSIVFFHNDPSPDALVWWFSFLVLILDSPSLSPMLMLTDNLRLDVDPASKFDVGWIGPCIVASSSFILSFGRGVPSTSCSSSWSWSAALPTKPSLGVLEDALGDDVAGFG